MSRFRSKGPELTGALSLVELANVLLRERRIVAVTALSATLFVLVFVLIQPPRYASRGAFLAESSAANGLLGMAGLPAQLRLSATGGAGQSPQFYASLLTSRPILEDAVTTAYPDPGNARSSITLMEAYEVDPEEPFDERVEKTIRAFEKDLQVSMDPETGIVRLTVEGESAPLVYEVAQQLLESVNEFDLGRRKSQASEERTFIEERMLAAESELKAAESQLEGFLYENRRFDNSPDLSFQHDRLQREVSMKQGIYNTLAESYEQARIEEVRTTPVITIVAPPARPAVPERRGLLLKIAAGVSGGLLLGVVIALARDQFLRSKKVDSEAFERFRQLREQALGDLRRPLGLIDRPSTSKRHEGASAD